MCWRRARLEECWGMHPWHWDLLECPGCPQSAPGSSREHPMVLYLSWWLLLVCHEICPSPVTLWQPLSCYLIDVYTAINTLLFISALSTSPQFVGSFMFLKCFGKSGGQSESYFRFCFKKKHPERQIIYLFILFYFISRRRCWGMCKPLCKIIPGKELKEPEIRYNSPLLLFGNNYL